MDTLTYAERCELAATHQGLDPIADDLWRVGIPYEIENMGGYCMGLTVRRGDHVVVVTTWDEPEGQAAVGLYVWAEWIDGGEPSTLHDGTLMVDVPELIVALLDGAAK